MNETASWLLAGLVLFLVVGVPMVVSGPGNDVDVAHVFDAGRSVIDLDYEPSRPPGAPVHEVVVGVLDHLGGPLLANLASVVAAVAMVIALDLLMAREGLGSKRRWAIAFVVANPWFLIAATSSVDYVLALAFLMWSALLLRNGHVLWSGLLAGLAMGSRVGSITIIAAILLAELTDHGRKVSLGQIRSWPWRRVIVAASVMTLTTVVLFVPSYLAAGGLEFARNDFSTTDPLVMLGRAAVKFLALVGVVSAVVLVFTLPAVARALAGWRADWLVRFSVAGLTFSAFLFLRFPWKVSHLLPFLVCGAVLLAVALHRKPRLLMVLVALQLVYGLVTVEVVQPDEPNRATRGNLTFEIDWGPVVTDWQCRREDLDAYLGDRQDVEAVWNCARPYGT